LLSIDRTRVTLLTCAGAETDCPAPRAEGRNVINDNHPDLWDSTESYSRVVYHQDFTGTTVYNSFHHLVYDLYGHGTH